LGHLNPPPHLAEFKHSSGKDGPNLKDRRKAMIEQIHVFQTHASEKTQSERVTLCDNYRIPGNRCLYNTEQMADHIERQTGGALPLLETIAYSFVDLCAVAPLVRR
jgi:hypothetical protein